jgi:hypothetical protein
VCSTPAEKETDAADSDLAFICATVEHSIGKLTYSKEDGSGNENDEEQCSVGASRLEQAPEVGHSVSHAAYEQRDSEARKCQIRRNSAGRSGRLRASNRADLVIWQIFAYTEVHV